MAWIESHQSLLTHGKLLRAAGRLHCDKYKLIGHLQALWWWGIDNADSEGGLGETFPEEIAAAAGWPASKGVDFVNALVFAKFLDETLSGYVLHNWKRYAGKLNDQRELRRQANRDAQSRRRQRLRQHDVSDDSQQDVITVIADADDSQHPTQPDQPTRPNTTNQPTNQTNRLDAVAARFAQFGKVTAGTVQSIDDDVDEFTLDWVERAVKEAGRAGFDDKPAWSYVTSILQRWKQKGEPDDDKPRLQAAGRYASSNGPRSIAGPDIVDEVAAFLGRPATTGDD